MTDSPHINEFCILSQYSEFRKNLIRFRKTLTKLCVFIIVMTQVVELKDKIGFVDVAVWV